MATQSNNFRLSSGDNLIGDLSWAVFRPLKKLATAFVLLVCSLAVVIQSASAQSEPDLAKLYNTYKQTFDQASDSFKKNSYEKCAGELVQCRDLLTELVSQAANAAQRGALKRNYDQVLAAHKMVKAKGGTIDDFPNWNDFQKQASNPKSADPQRMPAGGLSFTKDVSPILVNRCGNCHVRRTSGGLSMATFEGIQKGAKGIPLVTTGNAAASRMIEVIEGQEMPPNGPKVPDAEIAILRQWIDQGAKYDGARPSDQINVAPAMANANVEAMKVNNFQPPKTTTVSFARDIAPVIAENCKGCHVEAQQIRGNLNMNSFARLIRGGMSGDLLVQGNAKESLLVQKLRGTAGQQMPVNRPALDDVTIEKFETWINEGASFDGSAPDMALARVAELAWVSNATPEQLRERRLASAKADWRRVYGEREAFFADNEQLVVLSDESDSAAAAVLAQASEALESLRGTLRVDKSKDFFPSGATIFVFEKRYDYSEFGKMAESRSLPSNWTAHWRREGVNAYVALTTSSQDEQVMAKNLKINLAALWASSFDGTPRWFADGLGRFAYGGKIRSDSEIGAWEKNAQRVVSSLKNVQPLIEGKINEEDAAAVGFVFVRALNQPNNKRKFDSFQKRLIASGSFEAAFTSEYGPLDNTLASFLGLMVK